MSSRLLLVEPSATMRYVLENYAQSLGFAVSAVGDYSEAASALQQQFRSYGADFSGVLFGWPVVPSDAADSAIALLETPDYAELPVVVMSTDMRVDTRAWVAGREHTSVLAWKEYQGIDKLLNRMLEPASVGTETFDAKFDNSDVHVMVVDDSVSIRFALRDLLRLQGYDVSIASGHEEAMAIARESRVDVAVLDFYLQDGTGDVLCKKLLADPQTGDVTCAILTGTYADHIIKRSLRAGAVECMFKNESSELLLARIDALSRFVRQRSSLSREQSRLDGVIDALSGATLVIDQRERIVYISNQALSMLGFESRHDLLDSNADQIVDMQQIRSAGDGKFRASWQDATGASVNAVYRKLMLENSAETVINFKLLPADIMLQGPMESASTQMVSSLNLLPDSTAFLSVLLSYPDSNDSKDMVSLLLLDVFSQTDGQELVSIAESAVLLDKISIGLMDIYKRENHVARLSANRFAFILRHTTEPQAYLLTRKIMQICNDIDSGDDDIAIHCTGCMSSISNSEDASVVHLLERTQQGLDAVKPRGMDQALLLDLQRMLPVYPDKAKS